MEKGKAFLAATLALAAGIGGGMMAGVKTAQTKEEQIKNEAVEQAEQKGYELGLQAGIVVNQGYSQEELDQAVEQAEAEKQKIIDALSAENQTLTDKNTNLDQLNQNLQQQIEAGAKVETVTPGLYSNDGEMTKTWDDLIQEGIISLDETGSCKMNIDITFDYNPMNIEGAMEKLDMLQGKLVFSNDVKRISSYGFAYATGLNEVVVPESVTIIDSYAFAYCYNLKKITLPNSISKLQIATFADLFAYSGIFIIPDSVTSINGAAFEGFNGIIFVPKSVTSINARAFGDNTLVLLEADEVPNGMKTNAKYITGVSKKQVEFYNTLIKDKFVFRQTQDGNAIFQDGNKIRFYNFLSENLTTYGTESFKEYVWFTTYSENDLLLNNTEATYIFNYDADAFQKLEGIHTQFWSILDKNSEDQCIYVMASDGIYKIDTDVSRLGLGEKCFEKVLDQHIESYYTENDMYIITTTNGEKYSFNIQTHEVKSLN